MPRAMGAYGDHFPGDVGWRDSARAIVSLPLWAGWLVLGAHWALPGVLCMRPEHPQCPFASPTSPSRHHAQQGLPRGLPLPACPVRDHAAPSPLLGPYEPNIAQFCARVFDERHTSVLENMQAL